MVFKTDESIKKRRVFSWSLLVLYVSLIFFFTPFALTTLAFLLNKTWLNLRLSISFFALAVMVYLYSLLLRKKVFRPLLTLTFIFMGYGFLFFFANNAIERFHLFEYGFLSYFIYQALTIDLQDEKIYGWGMIVVIVIGTLDEVFQSFFPQRFGDLKDILINSLSALLGFGVITILMKASAQEKREAK